VFLIKDEAELGRKEGTLIIIGGGEDRERDMASKRLLTASKKAGWSLRPSLLMERGTNISNLTNGPSIVWAFATLASYTSTTARKH
jgi:hypothetical protein